MGMNLTEFEFPYRDLEKVSYLDYLYTHSRERHLWKVTQTLSLGYKGLLWGCLYFSSDHKQPT